MISFVREKIAGNIFVNSALCSLLIFVSVSCSGEREVEPEFSNEEIFYGIFFLEGKFKDKIDFLSKYDMETILQDEETKNTYRSLQSVVLKTMESNGFSLDNFGKALRSNDPIKIEGMLYHTSDYMMDAIHELNPYKVVEVGIENPEIINSLLRSVDGLENPEEVAAKLSSGELTAEDIHQLLEENEEVGEFLASLEEYTQNGRTNVTPFVLACFVAVVAAVAVILFVEAAVAVDYKVGMYEGFLEEYRIAGSQDSNLKMQILIREISEAI